MFSSGKPLVTLEELYSKITDADIAMKYFNIYRVPCVINSPLRRDIKPSLGIYMAKDNHIYYYDYALKQKGSILELLRLLWNNIPFEDVLSTIYNDFKTSGRKSFMEQIYNKKDSFQIKERADIKCRFRSWKAYDIEYWNSYGVSLKLLKKAKVYPISHIFFERKGEDTKAIRADKYAYCFIENKDNKRTYKIYQPFNTNGFKWFTNSDKSVWSLWTMLPKKGNKVIIASSLKDCLNIYTNLNIPAVCLQGEGYIPKNSVILELKQRFKNVIVFYDNDYDNLKNPGRTHSIELAKMFNLKRIEIPKEYESKDPSDLYKNKGKETYFKVLNNLLINLKNS